MAGYYTATACGATVAYAESVETVRDNLLEVRPTIVTTVPRLFERIYNRMMKQVDSSPQIRQKIFHWAVGVGRRYAKAKRLGAIPAALQLQHQVAAKLVFSKLKERTGGRIKFFVSGGAALPRMLGEFFEAVGIQIIEGYGLTETSPVLSANRLDDYEFGTVGKPIPGVEIKTLCDVDENLFASRANDPDLKGVATFKPGYVKDMRRVFDDKDIDGVIIATPNHWHALATIWALQAGKHVYVEKPASHTVWEGRKMVEAARKYGKMVQTGTMNRSRPAVRQAIQFLHEGGIGKVYMARGLCFKSRPGIGKYPDGPITDGKPHRLNVEGGPVGEGVWDASYLAKVDYDLWLGPAPTRPFNRNHFHYSSNRVPFFTHFFNKRNHLF